MAVQRQPSHQLCQGSPLSIRPSTPLFPSCLHLVSHVQQKHNMTKMSLNQAVPLHFPLFNFITSNHQGASQVVLVVKNPPANTGDVRDTGSFAGLGRPPGKGHGSPLQCSCLENPVDRGACRAIFHGVTQCRTWLKPLRTQAQSP